MNVRLQAARVGELLPPSRLHPAVARWLGDHRQTGSWVVAFSGGADSLALLLVLWALWPEAREKLVALHFNHRLRGREPAAETRRRSGLQKAFSAKPAPRRESLVETRTKIRKIKPGSRSLVQNGPGGAAFALAALVGKAGARGGS